MERTVAERAVVLVEASDLLRMRAYEPLLAPSARAAMQQRVLAEVDDLVGHLLQRVDAAHDAVLVVAPSQRRGPGRLTVVALRSPDVKPGLAESNWTRHSGLVHIVDIGPDDPRSTRVRAAGGAWKAGRCTYGRIGG